MVIGAAVATAERIVAESFLQTCLAVSVQTNCDREGTTYISFPSDTWKECRASCCRDPTCAGWTHNQKSGREMCYLKTTISADFTRAANASSCGVARQNITTFSPSPLPAACGGLAYVDFQRTRAGIPYVRVDAASYVDCQTLCCSDAKCRGWVFTPGSEETVCALIESPGGDYAASSVISG